MLVGWELFHGALRTRQAARRSNSKRSTVLSGYRRLENHHRFLSVRVQAIHDETPAFLTEIYRLRASTVQGHLNPRGKACLSRPGIGALRISHEGATYEGEITWPCP